MSAALVITPRSRLFHGHDWVYAAEVKTTQGEPEPGGIVTLKDVKGKPLGTAIYNPKSQIVARRFSFRKQALDEEFFVRRIERAAGYRETLSIDHSLCRLVWSESDGLPGLIVDRYGEHLVVQTLTLAMDLNLPKIVAALNQVLKPKSIVERNDSPIRKAEGMELRKSALHGSPPKSLQVKTRGMCFQVDLMEGQKTGLYLDQLDNYSRVAQYARGKRVLDCFANQGGFAQACCLAGAREVIAVDASQSAVDATLDNAKEAGVVIGARMDNVFDYLKTAEKKDERFDLIVLDPPSFTKTKHSLKDAMRGYKEIHLRALRMLEPGGILATFSCSHHVNMGDFRVMVLSAAVDVKKGLRLREVFSQRPDHPILAGIPETEYLRGLAYEVMGAW